MALLPASLLRSAALVGNRKFARDDGCWTEHWRMSRGCEFETEFQVLDKRPGCQICARNQFPGKRHAGTHQMARQAERSETAGSNFVPDTPGEFPEARD